MLIMLVMNTQVDLRYSSIKEKDFSINVRLAGDVDPIQHPAVKEACAQATERMAGRGRVLLRKSGTEPLVRVMVEGDAEEQVRAYAEELAAVVRGVCA